MPKTKVETNNETPLSARRGGRGANVQLVLDVLRSDGPSSQAAIARRTGLAPATVNNIIQALRADGVADIQWINGREALVQLVPKQGAIVSVCIGPDAMQGSVFNFAKGVRTNRTRELLKDDRPGATPEAAIELVRQLASDAGVAVSDLAGVSIAIQAPIDSVSGSIAPWAANRMPVWRNVPIAQVLKDALSVPVVVDNDANLAALAEWTWGTGRGADCFLYVTCSVGIGGGLIIDGKIHHGGNGMALEIGHIVIEQTGPVCFCGSRGCLSTLASERSILAALQGSESPKRSLVEVIESAKDGDPACQRVLYEAGRNLGRALANMSKILAPTVVAVGGMLSEAGPLVFDSLHSSIEENNVPAFCPSIKFKRALIVDATTLGGVAAVMSELGQGVSELPGWMGAAA
ncbi:ROK family transcriptional regulator [Burkholderia multivorans]|uniref:ROK family transcriptional regulator n=1 Tax=Burkholderia multivorans TaxID=87883 RepID=UPI002019E0D2|nr:ROK family transcriptional regulator [Burkholderia multivorans]MCO1368642.1 ROK family transcriptional regulator [Burkholderia multivorans]MCO1380533.1 ROK family transcriptional regulator [Burkholderia multivorans]UQP22040.1 ROK family transcriptional regulator [Burkholderia multivorans]UQP91512.1 ROK family transcriptional regulator [Burkholderia multivorans]